MSEENMRKKQFMDSEQNIPSAEVESKMQAHYDFSGGQRGRYAHLFPQKPGVVILSPDMAAIFPDSDSVNEAMRTLVKAVRGEASIPSQQEP